MVVQHNLQAMNANRMLNVTTGSQSKSAEKLSSGYRINRAADDAAGLTISEKMRKQIRGLDQASSNAEDGVSAVQTAEGALTEVHSMLQRMNELAVQASNGTNSEDDRKAIQDEIEQLTTEIDRVAETTKFNETYLLKGDADGATTTKKINAHDAGLKGTLTNVGTGTATFTAETINDGDKVTVGGKEYIVSANAQQGSAVAVTFTGADSYSNFGVAVGGTTTTTAATAVASEGTLTGTYTGTADDIFTYDSTASKWKNKAGTVVTLADVGLGITGVTTNGATITVTAKKTNTTGATYKAFTSEKEMLAAINGNKDIKKGNATTAATDGADFTSLKGADSDGKITTTNLYKLMAKELGDASSIGADTKATITNNDDGTFAITEGSVLTKDKLSFNLHVGADADMTNKINVDVDAMSAAALGIKGINVSDDSGKAATYAVDAIADALSKVSSQRSALGAVQNRLEHTIDNLDNVVENTTSAESRIRDVDMAEEMVEYSKNNILAQAGQSMLAQANQATQGVLSLLG